MRVTSLVALLAIVGIAGYFIFLTPDWAVDMYRKATGFGPASTPTEAQDRFLKAVKARDLKLAATYCTGEYAEHLKRAHTATKEIGPVIDGIYEYMKNKGLSTDKCVTYLHFLDPFPHNIKTRSAPKENSATSATGFFDLENIWPDRQGATPTVDPLAGIRNIDVRMFNRVAMPVNLFAPGGFEMVKDGDAWKLKFPLPPIQVQALDHYLSNYKSYHTGLSTFRRDVTNDRFDSKKKFEDELVTAIQDAK